jgi:hypothetical protein
LRKFLFLTIAIFATVALTPNSAFADSFTLGGTYQYVTLNGQYVVGGISGSTLNEVAIGQVFCDDSRDEDALNSTRQVNVNSLTGPWSTSSPMFATAGVTAYKEAAILMYEAGLSANANQQQQNLLQAAIWDVFSPGTGSSVIGLSSGADNSWLNWAAGHVDSFTYDGAEIFTPIDAGKQEFLLIGDTSPTPESPTLYLVGLGLLLLLLAKATTKKARAHTSAGPFIILYIRTPFISFSSFLQQPSSSPSARRC